MSVPPIVAFRPDPRGSDADWETVRSRVVAALTVAAPSTWTDHNSADPGITLAEAAAFGLADLHYRTATRPSLWPLEVPAWLDPADRHWHAVVPLGRAHALGDLLASPAPAGAGTGTTADVLGPLVLVSPSADAARSLLARAPWTGHVDPALVPPVLALLRGPRVRQVAQEHTDLVAAAVDAERTRGGAIADRDARAAAALAVALPLWPDELVALVRRERRRRTAEAVVDRLAEIHAATTPASRAAVRDALAADDVAPDDVDRAMAAVPTPPLTGPEDFEEADGASQVWPPHPLQALTSEPVTALDYARRARAHDDVGRAWAVRGRLAGVGWDGREVTVTEPLAQAVTLVVERVADGPATPDFLREVLTVAIGSEVSQPHPTWQDSFDPLDPRRLVCDEVGAAALVLRPVVLQGRLVTGVGADRGATVGGALRRVAEHFAAGRPESRPDVVAGPLVDGPWPRHDQPADGWTPGESIRFTEVVRALIADPAVLGVENLSIKVGAGDFVPSSEGVVLLDPDSVPGLADLQCLTVRLVLTGECADG